MHLNDFIRTQTVKLAEANNHGLFAVKSIYQLPPNTRYNSSLTESIKP